MAMTATNSALLTLLVIVWLVNAAMVALCVLLCLRRRRAAAEAKGERPRQGSPTGEMLVRREKLPAVVERDYAYSGHGGQRETQLNYSRDSGLQASADSSPPRFAPRAGSVKRTPPTYPSNNYSTQKSYASRIRDDPDAQSWTTQTSSSTLPPRPEPRPRQSPVVYSKSQVV